MLCIEKSGAHLVPTSQVIKKDDYAFLLEGQRIIELAKHEAKLIREEAQAEFERQRAAGHQQGLETGKAEITEKIVECMSQSAAYFSKVEDVMVELVMRAVRRVLGTFDRRELVEQIVKRALETTRNEGQVTVRVAPAQAEWLKNRVETILQTFPKVQFLEVLPDARLPEDGCVLETEIGVVDATLETQLKAIEKALIRSMK